MISVLVSLLLTVRSCVRSRAALHLEVLALRHQLQVLSRSRPQRLRLAQADGLLWIWLSRVWNEWRAAVVIVKPKTVIAWHRRAFRSFWSWKRRRRIGRPSVAPDVRTLILSMSAANPQWGAPRIHGELLKLGIAVSQNNRTEAGRAAKTINGELSVLRQVLKRAKLWYRFDDEYSTLRNRKPPVGRALTPEDQQRLFEIARTRPRMAVRVRRHDARVLLRAPRL